MMQSVGSLPSRASALALLALLSACVTPLPIDPPARTEALASRAAAVTTAPAAAVDALSSPALAQYLIVQGDQIGLINAADDGSYTYFAFRSPPSGLQVFDQEGKPLATSSSGTVAGVQGVHKGVLLKRGGANSFITPNPRAHGNDPRPALDGDPQIVAVRRDLDAQAIAMPAFRRALELSSTAGASPPLASTQGANSTPVIPPQAIATPARPALLPERIEPPAVVDTPEGRVFRVYFATAGRAVVSPDDGLARIEEAALQARNVRITGYADSVGRPDTNTVLAQLRAQTIREYLIRRGVEPSRISVAWDGTGGYLADNETARGRALNRRAEVLIQGSSHTPSSNEARR